MGQTCQDDTTELSRPGEPGLTTRMVEKGIQQHGLENVLQWLFFIFFNGTFKFKLDAKLCDLYNCKCWGKDDFEINLS